MANEISLVQHLLHPWAIPKNPAEPPCWKKCASIVAALGVGAIIGAVAALHSWYLGVILGSVGALASFYLFTFCMKKGIALPDSKPLINNPLNESEEEPFSPSPEKTHFPFHEKQTRGGLCGKHVINNAFGEEVEPDAAAYIEQVKAYIKQSTGADLPLDDPNDFGTDVPMVQHILETGPKKAKTKSSKISEIEGVEEKKSEALKHYVKDAEWMIIANIGSSKPFPSKGAAEHTIAGGHFFAGRKDEKGVWWFIDSRYDFQVDMPLSQLDDGFTIIVPV